MKHPLTITFLTSRVEPLFTWFFNSLSRQIQPDDKIKIVVVDSLKGEPFRSDYLHEASQGFSVIHTLPMPNVYQGKHRLLKRDAWAIPSARNTGVCYADDGWFATCDDRCVLAPTWLQAIREAMDGNYAVCGSYNKWSDMVVENGIIKEQGTLMGQDSRTGVPGQAIPMVGGGFYGCTNALPLEWVLEINGWDEESCSMLGMEDCVFGQMLENNGHPIKYDTRMHLYEDRSNSGTEVMPWRSDFGVSPNDKSHGVLKRTKGRKQACHKFDLRQIRASVLVGGQFPIPTGPTTDWWNGIPLKDYPP